MSAVSALRPPAVVLLDVDGTLVDYEQILPEGAARAVRAARRRGHRIFLCTGRSRAEIYPELWSLGVDGLIGGNGSYIEANGSVIAHRVLDAEVVERAVAWLVAEDLGFYLETNSGLYGSDNLPEKIAGVLGGVTPPNLQRAREGFPDMIYGTRSGRDDVNKISFVLEPEVDLARLAREFAGGAQIDTWSLTGNRPEFGEFGQLGIHKGVAVRTLADWLGVPVSDFIAFGDAHSDLELLTTCGIGVAMGNAVPELQEVADLVTDPVNANGLASAFVQLGLVDPASLIRDDQA